MQKTYELDLTLETVRLEGFEGGCALPGDGDDGDSEEKHQQAELLVGLLQRRQQRLQAGEVSHKLQRNGWQISKYVYPALP